MNSVINWVKTNPTKVLTGMTIFGIAVSTFMAFRTGTKAGRIMDSVKKDWAEAGSDKETKKEIIEDVCFEIGPSAVATAIVFCLTIACCIKNHKINSATIAKFSTIAGIATKQISDINEELIETLGEKRAKQISDKAYQRRWSKEHPNKGSEIKYIYDCGGDVFCGDTFCNVYFTSTYEKLNQAIENLSYQCAEEGQVNLNDLFSKLGGIDYIPICDSVVWTYRSLRFEVDNFGNKIPRLPIYTTTFIAWNDRPCLGLRYDVNI